MGPVLILRCLEEEEAIPLSVCCRSDFFFSHDSFVRVFETIMRSIVTTLALLYSTFPWTLFCSGRGLTFAAWVLSADCRVVIELEGLFQKGGAGLSF